MHARTILAVLMVSLPLQAQPPLEFRGHTNWVGGLAFHPRNGMLASASADRTIRLWNPGAAGMPEMVLRGHRDTVAAVAFSADGQQLASAGYDHAILWDLEKRQPRHILKGHRGPVFAAAFSHQGNILATGGIDGQILLWNPADGTLLGNIPGHTSWVNSLCFNREGLLASGSSDHTIRTWKKAGGRWIEHARFPVPFGEVRSLAFHPQGQVLAAGIRYGHLLILDLLTTRVLSKKPHQADVWAVAFSPDGNWLASGDGDWDQPGDVRLWHTATWKEKKLLKHANEVLSLAFSADNRVLAAGAWDHSIRVWPLVDKARPPLPVKLTLEYDAKTGIDRFSGRVFVLAGKTPSKDRPARVNWFKPEPFFAKDVQDWKPGQPLEVGDDWLGHPQPFAKLPPGDYYFQAVLDRDLGDRDPLTAAGNFFSQPVKAAVAKEGAAAAVSLVLNQVVPAATFTEKERVKLVEIESPLLAKFHRKPMKLKAAVLLPKSYANDPKRRYPVIYEIPGFSGTHALIALPESRNATDVAGVEMLYVMLDPSVRTGHHVFADSANNGPYGQALIEELIPAIEKRFRAEGKPAGRFLTGHSSGGWSSLWLQVNYPDFFNGTWSTAPDPVDFRDFQLVNIYEPNANLFVDDQGKARPLGRKDGKVILHYQPFSAMEDVLGRGGQLQSFEAVFSPRGSDGLPRKLWDRRTGAIDPAVALAWQKYDVRLLLEKNWATLGPKLAGKIHVFMGDVDTFYLDGATRLLKQSLARLQSDAVVELFPGKDHSNLLDANLRARIAREMAERYRTTRGKE